MSEEFGNSEGVTWVRDRDTGEKLVIDPDREYLDDMNAFYADECEHPSKSVYRVRVAGGAVQVRECCDHCGARLGNPMKQSDVSWVSTLPWQPEEHEATYKSRRDEAKYEMMLKHATRQVEERGRFSASYTQYLESDAWYARRDKVFKRCGGVCEGCGDFPAEHVHHMSYRHFQNEFLFELLGLCRECHDRLHDDERPQRKIR